jgi:hypothetical protein
VDEARQEWSLATDLSVMRAREDPRRRWPSGEESGLKLPVSGSTLRLMVGLFGALCVVNAFFEWSFRAWFSLWGSPSGLLSPTLDKWLVTPLAMAVYVLQYPSYAVLYRAPWLSKVQARLQWPWCQSLAWSSMRL